MENNSAELCQFLAWDSEFFGFRIAKVKREILTDESVLEIVKWCQINQIDCLYFLADGLDQKTLLIAEKNDFHLVDLRVNLENSKINLIENLLNSEIEIRIAEDSDIPQLRKMAAVNHTDSRFYYDSHFSKERCGELYATWIEKSCQGFADAVLVAELENEVAGYISYSLKNGIGNIGLVGVKGTVQGKGIGRLLVNQACQWFKQTETKNVTVVTQGRNVIAQRLYQKNGFITESIKLWYHLWFK